MPIVTITYAALAARAKVTGEQRERQPLDKEPRSGGIAGLKSVLGRGGFQRSIRSMRTNSVAGGIRAPEAMCTNYASSARGA